MIAPRARGRLRGSLRPRLPWNKIKKSTWHILDPQPQPERNRIIVAGHLLCQAPHAPSLKASPMKRSRTEHASQR